MMRTVFISSIVEADVSLPVNGRRWSAGAWMILFPILFILLGTLSTFWGDQVGYTPGDELGYFAWQQSWLVDFDIDPSNQIQQAGGGMFPAVVDVGGREVVLNKYSTGVSLAMLPLTAPARAITLLSNGLLGTTVRTDGTSAIDFAAARLAIALWAVAGIIASYRVVFRIVKDESIAGLATVFAWLGTATFVYTWKLPFWSHGAGLSMIALAFDASMGAVESTERQSRKWLAAGFFAGMAVTIRASNGLLLIPMGVYVLTRLRGTRNVGQVVAILAISGAGAVGPIAVEMLTRRLLYGSWMFNGYVANGEHFSWPPAHVGDVLFHFAWPARPFGQGVVMVHPVVVVALLGLLLTAIRRGPMRGLAIAALASIVATVLMYGCWWYWNLGYGFGARWSADFMVYWAIGIALFTAAAHREPRRAMFYLVPLAGWSVFYCLSASGATS